MKKKFIYFSTLFFCVTLCNLLFFQYNNNATIEKQVSSLNSSSKELTDIAILRSEILSEHKNALKNGSTKTQVAVSVNNKAPLSRGGHISSQNTYKPQIELLDWWKQAQYVFAINTTAVVTDISSGKSFKIMRTTGSNHADCEALTQKDTNIIKSIWGGFSWTRRPVILNINGKKLAASMSAMPHAGVDSAPAFAVVNNRSQGYGRGQNLDVIKENGMNGHFDVHFLNSTRHKDGRKDPQHQTAILQAAKN